MKLHEGMGGEQDKRRMCPEGPLGLRRHQKGSCGLRNRDEIKSFGLADHMLQP